MSNVAHDAVHSPREVDFVFIVHGHTDEQLRFSHRPTNVLSQLVPVQDEIIRVASHSCISHVRELALITTWKEAVQNSRDLALEDQLTIDKSDFPPGRLGKSSSSSVLAASWSWTIMATICFFVIVFCEGRICHIRIV